MASLRANGFATIIGSKELPKEVKDKLLSADEGKKKVLCAVLKDADGNEVVIKGKLVLSKPGSLMIRFATWIKSFQLVEVDSVPAKADKEENAKKRAKVLAEELANL